MIINYTKPAGSSNLSNVLLSNWSRRLTGLSGALLLTLSLSAADFVPPAEDFHPSVLDAAALIAVDPPAVPVIEPEPLPVPETLKGQSVPEPTNLSQFVRDKNAAIALGKALFWDMQLGSDGMVSCATCHFHAGADSRAKNAISPGLLNLADDYEPDPDNQFDLGTPNSTVTSAQLPTHKLQKPDDRHSAVLRDVNDVVGSAGVARQRFHGLIAGSASETLSVMNDDTFYVGSLNVRQVEPRNTPTVINSAFFRRLFWDGRAQEYFNGVNPFGERDSGARVLFASTTSDMEFVKVKLNRAALASQAVGPPLSDFEMSAVGRSFAHVGKKMLPLRPLAKQQVSKTDSVLGQKSLYPQKGLSVTTYENMVKAAFRSPWWKSNQLIDTSTGAPVIASNSLPQDPKRFSQMESNFSLFFGISLQLYMATLVSDDAPFDRHVQGDSKALSTQQKLGLNLFFGKAKCAQCHNGPELTSATYRRTKSQPLNRMIMGDGGTSIYDEGFYNIGVRPTFEDLGVGGYDPFDYPLSETLLLQEQGVTVYKRITGHTPDLSKLGNLRNTAVDGSFKTPTLRNIELTAPYFHNGGKATLQQVVEFYNHGGDFHEENIDNLDPDVENLSLSTQEKAALVAFLKSLTDDRVRRHKAPFDHPQLFVPNGHLGTHLKCYDDGTGSAKDVLLTIPAIGSAGAAPLKNFLNLAQ